MNSKGQFSAWNFNLQKIIISFKDKNKYVLIVQTLCSLNQKEIYIYTVHDIYIYIYTVYDIYI